MGISETVTNLLRGKTESRWASPDEVPALDDHPLVRPHAEDLHRLCAEREAMAEQLARARAVEEAIRSKSLYRLNPPASPEELSEAVPSSGGPTRLEVLHARQKALSLQIDLASARAKTAEQDAFEEINAALKHYMAPLVDEYVRLSREKAQVVQELERLNQMRREKVRFDFQPICLPDEHPGSVEWRIRILCQDGGWSVGEPEPPSLSD